MVIAAGEKEERVDILTVFIGIAHALFSSLGNLNSFMAVMDGLEAIQVKSCAPVYKATSSVRIYHKRVNSE